MYIQFCAEEDMCFSNNRLFRIESRKVLNDIDTSFQNFFFYSYLNYDIEFHKNVFFVTLVIYSYITLNIFYRQTIYIYYIYNARYCSIICKLYVVHN